MAAFFNPKAKLWINGRKNWKKNLPAGLENCIWIHASSLGEFEQGRPIIEKLKTHFPNKKILLTFFSPSGYEVRKNYDKADYIMYFPLDTIANANYFIDKIKPEIAIFVKYEYWFNFIKVLNDRKIHIYLVSAIFRSNQHFFKWYGAWFRKHLLMISHFFVQDKNSFELLKSAGIQQLTTAGDTRFDRVYENSLSTKDFPEVIDFIANRTCLMAGSSWEVDEILLKKLLDKFPDLCLILAPHEIHENHLQKIENLFADNNPVRLSKFVNTSDSSVLIVDSIGKLMHLYKYADFAYIGGGFGAGIHNILEAATFGKPVLFGPNYHKFKEAGDLIQLGGAFTFQNSESLIEIFSKMKTDSELKMNAGNISKNYVLNGKGATEIILHELQNVISV